MKATETQVTRIFQIETELFKIDPTRFARPAGRTQGLTFIAANAKIDSLLIEKRKANLRKNSR